MKTIFAVLLTMVLIQHVKCQEVLFRRNIKLSRGLGKERREAFPVKSITTSDIALFLIDSKSINGLVFNQAIDMVDSLEGERPMGKYNDLLGSSQSGPSVYNLYFANNAHKALSIVRCDFKSKTVIPSVLDIPFKGQKYIGSASYNGKFYMFTVAQDSSKLNLYAFLDAVHYTTHTYEFGKEQFTTNPSNPTLYDAVRENLFVTVDNEIPNAIDLVSKKNKIYSYEGKLVLTLDNEDTRTHVITIDANTLEGDLKTFPQRNVDCAEGTFTKSNSNSYIYKNILYQIRICPKAMVFSMQNLADGEVLNEFRAEKEGEMDFKNGPVIQHGSKATLLSSEDRELSKTRQFLRKVASADPGIAVYETQGTLEVTLGSNKEITSGSGTGFGSTMSPGSSVNIPGGGTYTSPPVYNPTYYGYRSYTSSISVAMKSLLDPQTFKHRDGAPSKNAFDKIQAFTKDIEEGMTAQTIFKREDVLLLGYYFKPNRRYMIRGFRD